MLSLLLLTWLLCTTARSQFILYDTERTTNTDRLKFNCLHYKHTGTFDNMNIGSFENTNTIEYCLRPDNDSNLLIVDFVNTRDQNFTFDELNRLNVTTQQLLSWSASIDLAERYQYYVDRQNNSSASEELFFNCTKPWFGSRCQYSFDLNEAMFFVLIIRETKARRFEYSSPYSVTNLTCYTHLTCDRGGSSICLDWREVCDGRIDCLNGGVDEAQCFDLEMNECNENEYRCHNGICIPNGFLKDMTAECLDLSDLSDTTTCHNPTTGDRLFHCEEHSCRPGYEQFSCENGQCVEDFGQCDNGRHLLLSEAMSAQGNLLHKCWMAMSCLTKIINQVNGTLCKHFLTSSNVSSHLQTCESLIQFPTIPVLFGHVRFIYRLNNTHDLNIELALPTQYVCYDEQLCDFLTPTFHNGNYSCQHAHEIGIDASVKPKNWTSIIRLIEPYFRKCLTRKNSENDSHHSPLLYCCKNSSKCISKHRIADGISDCYLNDDEQEVELSCSINDPYRFECPEEIMCRSPLFSPRICTPGIHNNLDDILFQQICDRTVQMLPVLIDGQNHTDETDCEPWWPCSNIYTRCDGFWSCPRGEDEENCTQPICGQYSLACVSPHNYTFSCLPAHRVGDEKIDCLGAVDELQFCRRHTFDLLSYSSFRCLNDTKCVVADEMCNKDRDCPFGDDEVFCEDHPINCYSGYKRRNRTNVEDALCRMNNLEKIQFSIKSSLTYPPSENKIIDRIDERPVKRHNIKKRNDIKSEPDDPAWPWRCNQGIYVRHWLGDYNYSYTCFCPPNYYGHMCQYQNQRVSLTMKLRAVDRHSIYVIHVTLIDDDNDRQEINSYHQSIYVSAVHCKRTFNFYLLYSTRPKNNSKNYSIRVDAFEKTFLKYLASWHYRIPFSFLPVNRLAIVLTIPTNRTSSPIHCPLTCHNGECMKYTNEEKFFCQCHINWSGARCDISIHCSDCSSDSICVGSIHNRSICVCPLNKFGSRCLIKLSCQPDFCLNNGSCSVLDESITEDSYICICPENFFGSLCLFEKRKLEISFDNMKVSSHLLIYHFFTDSSFFAFNEQPSMRVIAKKLTMFQRTTTVYSEEYFQMVFVKVNGNYYLALLQQVARLNISTSISPTQRCTSINELLNSPLAALPRIQRVKRYHVLCQTHLDLKYFFDESYMCLCTLEHHANCLTFNHAQLLCQHNIYCQNGADCLQDDSICPLVTTCICTDCFFGDRCQFYAKGIGLTLDDMLRYEVRPNKTFNGQSALVKVSASFTIIMFVAGLINSILSILTFHSKQSRQVGCGMYLLASSITSLLTVTVLTIKFWFLLLTQMNLSINRPILYGGCRILEFILKVCLFMDNWLNACVAIERAVSVFKGIHFNKMLSIRVARWTILFLPLLIMASLIHEPLHRDLYDDKDEQRIWCVLHYSSSVQYYNTFILFFHFLIPFFANMFSAVFIIFGGARQRAIARTRQSHGQHLWEQFNEHKQLVISAVILVVLSIPRLIISFLTGCVKAHHNSWLYISGYFVSFVPSVVVFVVFVLPSQFYTKQFEETIKRLR